MELGFEFETIILFTLFTRRHHQNNLRCAILWAMSLCVEVQILGDAAFTRKHIAHQNGEHGTVAARDVRARGQLNCPFHTGSGCGPHVCIFGKQ